MDFNKLAKQNKRKSLIDFASTTLTKVSYTKEDIYKIIPNRDPFVFIDEIIGVDLENGLIAGKRKILKDDPVFEGHFPGNPVYPGVLQLEMVSEIFCALYYFVSQKTTEITDKGPVQLRGTKMHLSLLQQGLFPEDEVIITAKVLEDTGMIFTGIGQIIKGNSVSLLTIGEFYII